MAYRYWAFISYSSKDDAVARKLHRKLEAAATAMDRPADGDFPRVSADSIRREVEHLASALTPRERILVRLRFRQGLKLRELATTLGYRDTNDAAYALRKALKRLDPGTLFATDDWSDAERDSLRGALREVLLE